MIYYFRYKTYSSAGKFYHIEPNRAYGWVKYPPDQEEVFSVWYYASGWEPIE